MGVNPIPGPQMQPVDQGLVAILNRLVSAQEKQANDKNESKRFTQFPTVKFDGSSPEKSLDHWNIFMQYWIYVLGKGYVPPNTDPNYYTVFCQQFILTLTGIAYTWFKQIQDNFNDINDVKAAFLKRFNEWGQTVKQHMTAWNNLKFDVQQHDMDVFTRKLRLLASILYMTDDQTVEKFKDSFDTNIAAHLIECETLAEAREKAEQLVFLYKNTISTTATTVLLHDKLPDSKEIHEHQLAPVTKVDKKGQHPKERNKQANNHDSARGQNSSFHRGQSGYRQTRGRSNQRGGYFRGRGGQQYDQRYNNRGRGFLGRGRGYDNGYGGNGSTYYPRGRGRPFQRRPWRSRGFQPRGRGYVPQAGTGDPEYRGIPQYRYICGICRNKGHYDHQCHTLQHLAHAMQSQQIQGYNNPTNNLPEYDNNNDQPAF